MRQLYLEQRIEIVRKALNNRTLVFQDELPSVLRLEFHQLILDCVSVLDGFPDAEIRLEEP